SRQSTIVCGLLPSRLADPFSFFITAPSTTAIYPLSLHDALPISTLVEPTKETALMSGWSHSAFTAISPPCTTFSTPGGMPASSRSEEHTSELQSRENLVCRLLLEKKKNKRTEMISRQTLGIALDI